VYCAANASLSLQEDIFIPSRTNSELDLDCASDLLDTLDTIQVRRTATQALPSQNAFQGLLNWLAVGRASLLPKLETLRLSYSSGGDHNVQSVEGIEQREIICCLHSRYPSLREVEMGDCRWWREGAHWSREILDFEEIQILGPCCMHIDTIYVLQEAGYNLA